SGLDCCGWASMAVTGSAMASISASSGMGLTSKGTTLLCSSASSSGSVVCATVGMGGISASLTGVSTSCMGTGADMSSTGSALVALAMTASVPASVSSGACIS